jgi:HSP20 family molecular chaperone IbpA
MAMAGYKKEDIEIEARDNHIVVSAKLTKDEPYKKEDVTYIKENLKAESFTRKFLFPDEAYDFRNPKVTYVDGMLTLWIKRNPELTAKDKKITIE